MKFEVGRNELFGALQAVIGVVERRQTLPVLSNLLMDTSDNELVVTGTDLELELVSRASVKTVEAGKVCLLYTSPSPRDLSTSRMPSSA